MVQAVLFVAATISPCASRIAILRVFDAAYQRIVFVVTLATIHSALRVLPPIDALVVGEIATPGAIAVVVADITETVSTTYEEGGRAE